MPRIYYIQYIVMTKIRHLHVIERRSLSIRNIISFYISVSKRACCLQLQNSTDFRSFGKDISKIAQKHLKEDDFFVTSLRCFKYISKKVSFVWRLEGISSISQKRCLFRDVSAMYQKYLLQLFVIFQKHSAKMISWDFQ